MSDTDKKTPALDASEIRNGSDELPVLPVDDVPNETSTRSVPGAASDTSPSEDVRNREPSDAVRGMLAKTSNVEWNSRHVSATIKAQDDWHMREYNLEKQKNDNADRHDVRNYTMLGLGLVLIFVLLLVLILVLNGKSELVVPVLTGIAGLFAGAISGFTLGCKKGEDT